MEPGPYTLRQLIRFDEARQSAAWDHTAQLLMVLINSNIDSSSEPVTIYDVHPYLDRPEPTEQEIASNWTMLGMMFDPAFADSVVDQQKSREREILARE